MVVIAGLVLWLVPCGKPVTAGWGVVSLGSGRGLGSSGSDESRTSVHEKSMRVAHVRSRTIKPLKENFSLTQKLITDPYNLRHVTVAKQDGACPFKVFWGVLTIIYFRSNNL